MDINAYQYLGRLDQEVDWHLFTKTTSTSKLEKNTPLALWNVLIFKINLPSKAIHLGLIYQPPEGSVLHFCQELTTYLEQNINTAGDILLMGDLNIHTNDPDNQDTIIFEDTIESLGLKNQVNFPTHRLQNTLDIIITTEGSSIISDTHQGSLFSDHYIVHYTLSTPSRLTELKRISYRKTKNVSIDNLKNEISLALPINQDHNSPDTIVHDYNKALMKVIDKLAPVKTKTVSNKPKLPWFNTTLANEIRKRKRLEKVWHKDRTNINNYHRFYAQRRKVSNMLSLAKKDFYKTTLNQNKYNYKKIYGICNALLGRNRETPLPICNSTKELANNFNTFFVDKIQRIRKELNDYKMQQKITSTSKSIPEISCLPDDKALKVFREVSIEETIKYIMKAPSKSCELDPVPIELLKEAIHEIAPILTNLVNTSFNSGIFPTELKKALLRPLLKKATLDPMDKNNFRPISNLAFAGKLMERIVADQITLHLNQHNLMEEKQSAYRQFHSTETALLRVRTDILKAMDNQELTCLILLDLSAAFDMVDHTILVDRLERTFGIRGTALKWITSFLTGRTQQVAIGDLGTDLGVTSDPMTMTCGVPQGSVLGPILFTLYTVPLGKICSKHHISHHLYADDTQLYLTFKPNRNGSKEACIQGLESCIREIREWMCMNLLKLNDGKTEFIILGTHQQLQKIGHTSIQIGEDQVTPVDMVRNLGFFMDKHLKNKDHINRITSSTYNMLRKIQQSRSLLDNHTTKIIVQALVLSKMDYCNSLLLGSPEYQIDKLQRIQNMACRVIFKLRKHDHITQHLKLLHWLKIRERITYKIALLIHKCKNNQAPVYLQELLPSRQQERLLRSSRTEYLISDFCKNTHTLKSSFSAAGPKIWNQLPLDTRTEKCTDTFKKKLKTHLFKISYA